MSTEKIEKLLDKNKTVEAKVEVFRKMLDSLEQTDQKKKALWKEIYENAVSDRERASILFTEAYKTMGAAATDHVAVSVIASDHISRSPARPATSAQCSSNGAVAVRAPI